jgi:pimeloyl-ACP methyl ester carboxylesterase
VGARVLEVAYYQAGPADGPPVLLRHGFPYDIHGCEAVIPPLADAGLRMVVPYLRGTHTVLDHSSPRSGQQAAPGSGRHRPAGRPPPA